MIDFLIFIRKCWAISKKSYINFRRIAGAKPENTIILLICQRNFVIFNLNEKCFYFLLLHRKSQKTFD